MYDSHSHLNSEFIEPVLETVLKNFSDKGGRGILNVAFDLESCFRVIEISKNYFPEEGIKIYSSIGLHPELFYTRGDLQNPITSLESTTRSINIVKDLIGRNRDRIHCVGETGLDYRCIKNDTDLTVDDKELQIALQKHSFGEHIKIALEENLPLTIHLRDVEGSNEVIEDALSIIALNGDGLVKGSFHSYTLPIEYLDQIFSLGFMIGVNGIVTYKSGENIREIVRKAGLENILLETDTPYLPPQKIRSQKFRKNSEPVDIFEIAEVIAETLSDDKDRVLRVTSENFLKTFAPHDLDIK